MTFLRNTIVSSLFLFVLPLPAQIPGRNVNMVSGTKWPDGDPFLQGQNSPSLAVSSRNANHILAGATDYRSLDLPGRPGSEAGDAWLGIFKSYDGGQSWKSTLHPGCPQNVAACDGAPGLKNYTAGSNPVVRAGTNGMFYYAGLAFTRTTPRKSAIFVSRFIDNNNEENGDPIRFVSTASVIATRSFPSNDLTFHDRPWIAVDIPRTGAATCQVTVPQKNGNPLTQKFAGGNVYLAWTTLTDDAKPPSQIMFSRSTDCGATWSLPLTLADGSLHQGATVAVDPKTGAVYVAWRRFKSTGVDDAILFAQSTDGGQSFGTAKVVASIAPFDQVTSATSFRTSSYPAMAVDGAGRVYLAWSERDQGGTASGGDARVVVTTSRDRLTWSRRKPVNDFGARGHQFMPAMTAGGGKAIVVYYDARLDSTVGNFVSQGGGQYLESRVPVGDLATSPAHPEKVFAGGLQDAAPGGLGLGPLLRRHTIDVFAAQADVDDAPVFTASRVSKYIFGSRPGAKLIEQLQVNPPNLPLYEQGTAAYLGDYLDVAASPSFLLGDTPGAWKFNADAGTSTAFHAAWTDNRDVRPPANGNWADYTPPTSASSTSISIFDPAQAQPACRTGQSGMRNQNIYTSRITQGLLVTSPSNAKTLGTIQRAFPVNLTNSTGRTHTFRITIGNQPNGGKASLVQFPIAGFPDPLTALDVSVTAGSSISRMVFIRSTEAQAAIRVNVDEIVSPGAASLLTGGLAGSVVLNPDPVNPANVDTAKAEVFTPDIANPDIANPDIANPDIANPDIANPDIANPDIANPDIANPDIANPDIANPDIANPDIANPDIANPDIANASISDLTWKLGNHGNTTATYSVEFLLKGLIPPGVHWQLVIHRVYQTPVANGCSLVEQPQTIVVTNVSNPPFATQQTLNKLNSILQAQARAAAGQDVTGQHDSVTEITDDSVGNATLSIGTGETVYITLRFFNPVATQPLGFDPAAAITTVSISHASDTGSGQPAVAASHLIVATTSLPSAAVGAAYDQLVVAAGGTAPYHWSLAKGALPPGLALSGNGAITGVVAPGTPLGPYAFTVEISDSSSPAIPSVQQDLSIQVSGVSLSITSLTAAGSNGASVNPGGTITVTVAVANAGSPVSSVNPSLTLIATGTASANCGGPSPAGIGIAAGGQGSFTFLCPGVTGSGTLKFSVGLTATDPATGSGIGVSPSTSNSVTVVAQPPKVTVSATAGGASYGGGGWTNQDVVVKFICTPLTGNPAEKTVTVTSEGANQTVSTTCTDAFGNSADASFGGINIDKTPPAIAVEASAGGEVYTGGVTSQTVVVTFTCSDPGGSGVTVPVTQQSFGNGLGQVAEGVCTDVAGNSSSRQFGPINVVKAAPPQLTASLTSGGGAYSTGSWTRNPVAVSFNCVAVAGASVANVSQPVTVSGEGGNQFVSGSCTDSLGNQAQISVGPIQIDRTPPAISLIGPPPAGWYNTDVTLTWQCTDQLTGLSTVSRTVSTEGANQTVSATCTDLAGNTASASATVSIDKMPPVLTGGPSSQAPASGWYRGAVSVTFNCSDALSGVAAGYPTGNANFTADTTGSTANGSCRDQAGNTASLAVGPIRIDTTAPVTQYVSASGVNNAGWANGPVTVTFACTDSGSGPVAPTVQQTLNASGVATGTCTDVAGNSSTGTSPQIKIDTIPPIINVISPLNNFSYPQGQQVFATYLCSDSGGSLIASCVGDVAVGQKVDTSQPGPHSFTVTATDVAGNVTVVTRQYTVTPGGG